MLNVARMNMLMHGAKDTEFEIVHGDTLREQGTQKGDRLFTPNTGHAPSTHRERL